MMRGILCALVLALSSLASARTSTLEQWTEVPLILLKQLGSGLSRLNEQVPMAVARDVVDEDGNVLIAEGTLVLGKVVQVRREGALSATVFDKPARLAIEIERTWAVDDQEVKLKENARRSSKEPYHFKRENTGLPQKQDPALADAYKVRRKYEVINSLVDTLKGGVGHGLEGIKDRGERNFIAEVAKSLSLTNTANFIIGGTFGSVIDVAKHLRDGNILQAVLRMPGGISSITTSLRAVVEIAKLSRNMAGYIEGRFMGRNIHAHAGTELYAFVEEPVRVRIRG